VTGNMKNPPIKKKAPNLRDWRLAVLSRDNNICRKCGSKKHVVAHHIKSRYTYPGLRLRVDNGISLCRRCHAELKEYALRLLPMSRLGAYPSGINLEELGQEIRHMTRRQGIYRVLKTELSLRGYWKARPRGDPKKGYRGMEHTFSRLSKGK